MFVLFYSVNFFFAFLSSALFACQTLINVFEIIFQEVHRVSNPDHSVIVCSDNLIWIQFVCKSYQQTTLGGRVTCVRNYL